MKLRIYNYGATVTLPEAILIIDGEARIEQFRRLEIAKWRRRARKIAVFKAIGASGLLFLICGSAALVAYALEW